MTFYQYLRSSAANWGGLESSNESLEHHVSTATKHCKWSYKDKKGTDHAFYMPLPVTLVRVYILCLWGLVLINKGRKLLSHWSHLAGMLRIFCDTLANMISLTGKSVIVHDRVTSHTNYRHSPTGHNWRFLFKTRGGDLAEFMWFVQVGLYWKECRAHS